MTASVSYPHWESYYRRGEITTCPVGSEPNYSAEVRSAWASFFYGLKEHARIVDIGTGNGAIALLAKEAARECGKTFEIHGVDQARVQPAVDVAGGAQLFAGIEFHPATSAEALPFDSQSIDAACGQYALEYTDLKRSLREILRVQAPGAAAQFILHSQDSVLHQNAVESLRHARLVFEELKLFDRCRDFLAAERQGLDRMQAASDKLTHNVQRLQQAAHASANPHFLLQIGQALDSLWQRRAAIGPAATSAELAGLEHEVQDGVARLRDIMRHALGGAELETLLRQVQAVGFIEARVQPQTHAGHIVGWRLNFRSP